jgi:H+/Cl- antiporter ClcA
MSDASVVVPTVLIVAFLATSFAHAFREAIFWVAETATGDHSAVEAARTSNRWFVFASVTAGLFIASVIGRSAVRWRGQRLGMSAVAAAARGEGRGPSLRATALRGSGTFVASASLASIGRETAIMEMGTAVGTIGDRVVRRPGSDIATVGLTAAFAAAYHAPIAAVLYAEEHLGVRRSRRTSIHAAIGAVSGFFMAKWVYGADAVLPHATHP